MSSVESLSNIPIEKLEGVQRTVTRWVLSKDISYEEETGPSIKTAITSPAKRIIKFIKGNSVSNSDDYMSFSNCRRTRSSHNYKLCSLIVGKVSLKIHFGIDI